MFNLKAELRDVLPGRMVDPVVKECMALVYTRDSRSRVRKSKEGLLHIARQCDVKADGKPEQIMKVSGSQAHDPPPFCKTYIYR